jgi:hypothetical protein
MKRLQQILLLSLLIPLSTVCSAEQNKDSHMNDAMTMDSGQQPMDPAKMEAHLKERQAYLLAMHDLSSKILAETDPTKQQALKDQQLELMKAEHIKSMSRHSGKPMHNKQMH